MPSSFPSSPTVQEMLDLKINLKKAIYEQKVLLKNRVGYFQTAYVLMHGARTNSNFTRPWEAKNLSLIKNCPFSSLESEACEGLFCEYFDLDTGLIFYWVGPLAYTQNNENKLKSLSCADV